MNFINIVKFDIKNTLRNPMLLIINTLLPIILLGTIGFIAKEGYGSENVTSYDYYGITLMIFMGMMLSMTATNVFMEETVRKGNTRIVYAPVSKTEIYLSKIIVSYIVGAVCYSLIMLGEQYLFHINFGGKNILYILLLINALGFFGSCLGVLFCCIFKSEQGANGVMQIPILIFVFLGGVFFPIASLGKTVEALSNISPLRWITQCAFQVIYDNNFSIYLPTIVITLLAAIICIILCQIIFKPEEYV
ncbi:MULTISPECIES: ABC transporter permease [Clostridium]|uniref:ABC transporter permease n=1 Tax=Clostridium TaxID=1485 RepID=UPI00069E9E33|nr:MULTISPECIES: ABC transporter permease [Clostridium]KOF56050.1 ABC transporter permease [Clostridium sp. DMHC 10]MCD2345536.1 ABC transporter permease [Clostridium guangxiense]